MESLSLNEDLLHMSLTLILPLRIMLYHVVTQNDHAVKPHWIPWIWWPRQASSLLDWLKAKWIGWMLRVVWCRLLSTKTNSASGSRESSILPRWTRQLILRWSPVLTSSQAVVSSLFEVIEVLSLIRLRHLFSSSAARTPNVFMGLLLNWTYKSIIGVLQEICRERQFISTITR